jgi:hypothetical protein
MSHLFVFVALIGLLTETAHAQTKADTEWATIELSSELTECAQYFLISSVCLKNFPNPDAESTANDYLAMSNKYQLLALQIAESAGISEEAALARMRLINKTLTETIHKDCGDISILLERYATFCKTLTQQPDQRFKELVQCSTKKTAAPCEGH